MQGRITEAQLPLAEESFPGIIDYYNSLQEKPATFLQLVWLYQTAKRKAELPRRSRPGRRGGN